MDSQSQRAPGVHVFVMAGGAGTRLRPLTSGVCKPALPFAGNYCVVDFVLGNLWNSGLAQVDLLVQHEPEALIEHVDNAWQTALPLHGEQRDGKFVCVVKPSANNAYRGTADAVYSNLPRVSPDVELVLVFGADHVYRMDVRQMIDFHLSQRADATVATLPVTLAEAASFGIAEVDGQGRIRAFQEKPRAPLAMPNKPGHALASMGNYVFRADVLRRELALAHERGDTDFGQHVLPRMLSRCRVLAYDFTGNRVPGVAAHVDRSYWRDVGTLDAYFDAHLDTLGSRPTFELDNPLWPVLPHAATGRPPLVQASQLHDSCISASASVKAACIEESVVGRLARVRSGARLSRSILLDRTVVGSGARLRKVIVDRDNVIPPGEVIGFDPVRDAQRFPVSPGGVVIVPRGHFATLRAASRSGQARDSGSRLRGQPSLLPG